MVRYDLTFFLCCCKSFLGPTHSADEENFYNLLGVESDATAEEIKKAYKRRSLEMHPDKLAQRGKQVMPEDQARFTRMKEAYEILSDPHKRETYDALGEKAMKWLEEPFSVDPQQLAQNFAASSLLDRSKIFAIFVSIAIAIFVLPLLICLQVDGHLGHNAQWMAVLTPLWIWDVLILFYHSRVILMGPIPRPEHIPEDEWVDPLPMSKRFFSLFRFLLVVVFEFLAGLKLDDDVPWTWATIFVPLYVWEATTLFKKLPLARMRIVTVEDLVMALGKPFAEFTQAERELIGRRYSVVPSTTSPEFEAAHKLKARARQDCLKVMFRLLFIIFVVINLDFGMNWNWWAVFTPLWVLSFCICCGTIHGFRDTVSAAAERDPETFGIGVTKKFSGTRKDEENPAGSSSNYGAMGDEGERPGAAPDEKAGVEGNSSSISDEEREELKAQVMQSGHRMMSSMCTQAFVLTIVCLFVGKIQGAEYSSLVIISPFLFFAGIILCCLGCTIFCITEIEEESVADYEHMPGMGGSPLGGTNPKDSDKASSTIYMPPPTVTTEPRFDNKEAGTAEGSHVKSNSVGGGSAVMHSSDIMSDEGNSSNFLPQSNSASPASPADLLDNSNFAVTRGMPSPLVNNHNVPQGEVSHSSEPVDVEERKRSYAGATSHSSLHELD